MKSNVVNMPTKQSPKESDDSACSFICGLIIGFVVVVTINVLWTDKMYANEIERYDKACVANGGIEYISSDDEVVRCVNGAKFNYDSLYKPSVKSNDPPIYDILNEQVKP